MPKIRANYSPETDEIDFYGVALIDGEEYGLVHQIYGKHTKYSKLPCFFSMRREEAQELLDSLCSCGLRPTAEEPKEQDNERLEDMRKIVFALLKVNG